jgi:hypothetical protein
LTSRAARRSSLAANLGLGFAAVLVSLALLEGAFQLIAHVVIFPRFDRDMARPNFFMTRSENPRLGYEMKPGFTEEHDGKRLHINRYGIRADGDELFPDRRKIAVLGDSVTMSAGFSQERALPVLLEARLRAAGHGAVVINFGVPGYGTRELLELLERKNEIYRVQHVVYLLNPNDFARRDSVYEGADNGLYRMFERPAWQTPWFLRKAVYRVMKGREMVSTRWYRWLYSANAERAQDDIRAMARACARSGAGFSVVLMPAGVAYGPGGEYELAELYADLSAFLRAEGIPSLAPIAELGVDPARYFDPSDHFWDAGNEHMAGLMHAFLESIGAVDAPPRGEG